MNIALMQLTIRVNVHRRPVPEQHLEYVKRAALGAVVQCRVAFNALPVHIRTERQQVLGDSDVALVACDHQARVPVAIRYLYVWNKA